MDFRTKHHIPDLGVGIGARAKHYSALFGDANGGAPGNQPDARLDWLEVISENFMVGGGKP
ncbi:MAG: hypothetical protein ABI461_01405, partial [Polyangiaceae bacterium]